MESDLMRAAKHRWQHFQEGKIGYAVAWLVGVPLPILLLIYLLRGCN